MSDTHELELSDHYFMVRRGELPPPVKLSPRVLGWRRRDVYPITA
jgi:predicted DNA-binding transcriptional regulator AlpA